MTPEQFLRYLHHWLNALHETKPPLDITSNWMYSTYAPLEPEIDLDYLSGDFSPQAACERARLEARYLASTGKPWDLMAWGFNRPHNAPAAHQHKPAVQLMQEASVVLPRRAFQHTTTTRRAAATCPSSLSRSRPKWRSSAARARSCASAALRCRR